LPNAQLKLRKASPERLRTLGLDEVWLQEQIAHDPSLLNLGDEMAIIRKEKPQPSGGRIDFVMADRNGETWYEIELMLGETDPSHIIRTIEYWDVERQRYPTLEHRAVIVAEVITARFFNVIRLLNRAAPIIAIQLSAFRFGDEVVLHFTRVLDIYEPGGDPEDVENAEPVDRAYWEKKANHESLAVVDSIKAMVPSTNGDAKLTYNKHHIALGTSGYNFIWFHPRKSTHCNMHIKVGAEKRPDIIKGFEELGIEAENQRSNSIRLNLSNKDIQQHGKHIAGVVRTAEEWSHR
jgi:hypothetical protein